MAFMWCTKHGMADSYGAGRLCQGKVGRMALLFAGLNSFHAVLEVRKHASRYRNVYPNTPC